MITIFTYQDLLEVPEDENARMEFAYSCISQHKSTDLYQTAVMAQEYAQKENRTIIQYQKLLYTITGEAVPDNWSANFKMGRAFFPVIITQEVEFLLGNGISWQEETTADKLGTKRKPIDTQLQDAAYRALVGSVAFGFFNLDHVDIFGVDEFAPLYDEENGHLRAGVRFWQIDDSKPMRATLYEEDGYTDYIWKSRDKEGNRMGEVLNPKRAYKQIVTVTEADGMEISDGGNYPGFPIIPLWGNRNHQSEIVGIREQIDCYDLIKSGFANTVDEASFMYWAIQNAGGMDDIDLAKFVERMKTMHAAVVEQDGARAEPHNIEAPYASREALLNRLEIDIYKDAMALDIEHIAAGANTATQIRAAYEPLNEKADGFEYCIHQFLAGILEIAGVEDEPTFTRSTIVNVQEEVQTVLTAASVLDQEYVTRKILTILGDGDQADEIVGKMQEAELQQLQMMQMMQGGEMGKSEEPETSEETDESDGVGEQVLKMLDDLLAEVDNGG